MMNLRDLRIVIWYLVLNILGMGIRIWESRFDNCDWELGFGNWDSKIVIFDLGIGIWQSGFGIRF